MMKSILVFCCLFAVFSLFAEANFMEFDKGQENCDYMNGPELEKGFMAYSSCIVRDGRFLFYKIPKVKTSDYNFTGLEKIPVKPGIIYTLKISAMGQEKVFMLIQGILFKDDKYIETISVLRNIYFLNVNGMTTIEKDFSVPPGVNSMILNIGFPVQVKGKKNRPGVNLVISELSVREEGPMKSPPREILEKNFMSPGNFKDCKLGEYSGIFKARGKNAKRWSDVDAQVVEFDGAKCLRIKRAPENYIYPFFTSQPFNFDPQNYYIKASVTARGEGDFRLGLWWERKKFNRDYQNRVRCELSDKWQTFTEIRPCLSPLVNKANVSINSKGDAIIYIKDIKLEFVK